MVMRLILLAACALALTACQTTQPVTTVRVCAVIAQFTPAEQRELARIVRATRSPALDRATRELVSLREQARACLRRAAK